MLHLNMDLKKDHYQTYNTCLDETQSKITMDLKIYLDLGERGVMTLKDLPDVVVASVAAVVGA